MKPRTVATVIASLVTIALSVGLPTAAMATTGSSSIGVLTATPRTSSSLGIGVVTPMTSGWHSNLFTAIDVLGTGLHVNTVEVQGISFDSSGDAYAVVYDTDYQFAWETNYVSWSDADGATLTATIPVNENFPNGDEMCTEFVGEGAPSGNPCITIHN